MLYLEVIIYLEVISVSSNLLFISISPTSMQVMCFHNEAWTVLLRSVYSILDRSDSRILREVILVDDFSTQGAYLFGSLTSPISFAITTSAYHWCRSLEGAIG